MASTDQDKDTKYCSNCKRDIAVVNFVMHEVHCRRNITLCPKCHEPVPRSEMEEHEEEEHAIVNCELCRAALERNQLQKHTEECPKRTAVCPYCEIECPRDEMDAHIEYCGSRTELCVKCNQYIMHKNLAKHEETNCTYPQPKPQPSTSSDTTTTNNPPPGFIDNLGGGGGVNRLNSFVRGEFERYGSQPGAARYVDRPEFGMRRNNQPERGGYLDRYGPQRQNVVNTRNEDSQQARPQHKHKLPAKVPNRKTVPNNRITEHEVYPSTDYMGGAGMADRDLDQALAMQMASGLDLDIEEIDDHMLAENLASMTSVGSVASSASSGPGQPTRETRRNSSDEELLPCEVCGEAFPLSVLIEHQSICDSSEAAQGYSSDSAFPGPPPINTQSSSGDAASSQERPANQSASEHNGRSHPPVIGGLNLTEHEPEWSPSGPSSQSDNNGDMSEDWFPCEFCDDLFPFEVLMQHQSVCDSNPYQTPRAVTPKVTNPRLAAQRQNAMRPDPLRALSQQSTASSRGGAAGGTSYSRVKNTNIPGAHSSTYARYGANRVTKNASPAFRRQTSATKSQNTLNEFMHNPSYTPNLHLPGNSGSSHDNNPNNRGTRPGNRRDENTRPSYQPSFAGDRTTGRGGARTKPRLVPRTNYDATGLGDSLRTGSVPQSTTNTRDSRGRIRRTQRDV